MQIEPDVWKILEAIKAYLLPTERYLLAVSGGADSMALADAAATVFAGRLEQLSVCHVEHGIRGQEALLDAELVERFCRERGLGFSCCHVAVPAYAAQNGYTMEEAARRLRYAALAAEAAKLGARAVVTAHQADDQVENLLWKLLRGAGTDGLSGMRTVSRYGELVILRPLLEFNRKDLEQYCRLRGLQFCTDSSNADPAYTRNRIRNRLLPYLEQEYNPAVREALLHASHTLAEEQECLQRFVEKHLQDSTFCGILDKDTARPVWWLAAPALKRLPVALRKRILREICFSLGIEHLSYERTNALDKLCLTGVGGKLVQLPEGITASYRNKKIYIAKGAVGNEQGH